MTDPSQYGERVGAGDLPRRGATALASQRVVCVIFLKGEEPAVERAERRIRRAAATYYRLRVGVWIAELSMRCSDARDEIGDGIADLEVLVVKLDGRWASKGYEKVSNWLKEERDDF